MKVSRGAIGNIACVIMHENMDEFSSAGKVEPQALEEMQFALDIKRALNAGAKRIVLEITEDRK